MRASSSFSLLCVFQVAFVLVEVGVARRQALSVCPLPSALCALLPSLGALLFAPLRWPSQRKPAQGPHSSEQRDARHRCRRNQNAHRRGGLVRRPEREGEREQARRQFVAGAGSLFFFPRGGMVCGVRVVVENTLQTHGKRTEQRRDEQSRRWPRGLLSCAHANMIAATFRGACWCLCSCEHFCAAASPGPDPDSRYRRGVWVWVSGYAPVWEGLRARARAGVRVQEARVAE